MKRIFLATVFSLAAFAGGLANAASIDINAREYVLIDFQTGAVLGAFAALLIIAITVYGLTVYGTSTAQTWAALTVVMARRSSPRMPTNVNARGSQAALRSVRRPSLMTETCSVFRSVT